MLSIENHPPADPNENSLKRVDLSNPSLDDHNPVHNFSIRDYVFNARSKSMKTNWPFSQKSLQLCLDHGVKDILPPFQCLDCVKNGSSERDGVESSSSEKGKLMNLDMEPLNKGGNVDPNRFESCDKRLQVTINNPPPLEVSPKTSEKSKTRYPKKPEISKTTSMKKCRLTLKVGPSGVEPSSNLTTGSTMVEPTGSSKVCPVCKKFSSSSNTTLNAHIDQCLSMDSPIEPSSKSILIKHRIKPRKTRLMVDIYATAPHCTLEELDRRNGRIWSEKPSLPTIKEDDEVDCGEEKKQSVVFDHEKDDEGAVYIDANGTKLRILNKISDTSSVSKLELSPRRLGKPFKGDKGKKPLSTYKKKKQHNKYLKFASQRENTCSYKTRLASRVLGDQEKESTVEESPKKDEKMDINNIQISKSREQVTNSGTILPKWASSKGTDLLKRQFESNQSSLGDSYLERSYAQKGKEIDNSSCEGRINKIHEQPPSKKQMGFKSFESQSIKSVGRTFSSSREDMLSVDQSSSHEPKSCKNIRFAAGNGADYNEKHLKHKHRTDGDARQVHLKRSTVLKIKKKKSAQNRDSPEIPPPSARFEDGFVNTGSPRRGETIIGQSSGTDSAIVMSLPKSFDQNFYSIGDTDMDTEVGPTDFLGNYFSGVDPITIPGPPGSFLPSPGRSSSDEDHHGSSSLTTSQVQSSVDHLETVDRNSSNSPKSANSTVSNSLIPRSDLKSRENLPQDEIIKLGFSEEITKSTLGFQDGQPCSCSHKEGVSEICQESQLLRRRVTSFFPDPTGDKQSNSSQNNIVFPIHVKPSVYGDFGSPSPSQSNSSQNNTVFPIHVKPSVYGDFGSPSPSAPSPVLRLMGKNLVVVNNDEILNQNSNSKFQAGPSDNHLVHQITPICGRKGLDLDLHEYKPNFDGVNRSLNSPFSPLRYNKSERVDSFCDPMQRKEDEVRTDGMNVIRSSSGGFPIPLSGYYNSEHLNPFQNYQGMDFSTYRGPHMIPYVNSPLSPSSSGPMRWNNVVLEGFNILPQSSLASSPSTNRVRPSLYYSPSMS